MSILFRIAVFFAAVIGVVLGAIVFLGNSDAFLKWLLRQPVVTDYIVVTEQGLTGDLFGPIRFERAELRIGEWQAELANVALRWQPRRLLDTALVIENLTAARVSVRQEAEENDAPAGDGWTGFESAFDIDVLRLAVAELEVEGVPQDFTPVTGILVSAKLENDRVEIRGLEGRNPLVELTARGKLQLNERLPAELNTTWRVMDPRLAVDGTATLDGDIRGAEIQVATTGDITGHLDLSMQAADGAWNWEADAALQRVLQYRFTELRLDSEGTLSSTGELQADVQWSGLALLEPQLPVTSATGRAALQGSVEDLLVSVDAGLTWRSPGSGPTELQTLFEGRIAAGAIEANSITVSGPAASLRATGNYDLDTGRGRIDADVERVDTALFSADWPGSLTLDLVASQAEGRWQATLSSLSGSLRGASLTGQLTANGASADPLAADISGTAEVSRADIGVKIGGGRRSGLWDLTLQSNITDAASIDSRFGGSASLDATLKGNSTAPVLQVLIDTGDLAYQGQAVGTLSARLEGTIRGDGFEGRLQELNVVHPLLTLTNTEPAPLSVGVPSDSVVFGLGPLCLSGGDSRLCLEAANRSGTTRMVADIQSFQLGFFDPFLGQFATEGALSGALEVNVDGERIAGGGDLRVTSGQVVLGTQRATLLTWQGVQIEVDSDGQALVSSLVGDLGNDETAAAEIRLSGEDLNELAGNVRANTTQLRGLRLFLPEVKPSAGRLNADLALSGSLVEPKITGELQLLDARLDLVDLAVSVHDGQARAKLGDDRVDLSAAGKVQDSEFRIDGFLTQLEPLRGEFTLASKNLLFIDSPEARLFADADLKAVLAQPWVEVSGNVRIPRGQIDALPRSAITPSEDQIIVGQLEQADSQEPWRAAGKLNLTLGPELGLSASGLRGQLDGSLELTLPRDGSPVGSGEVNLRDGTFQVFRQVLAIERGALVFSNGPVANPGLDLRAVRIVGEQTVGVLARGPLNDPIVELFAEPSLSTSDTLSYLTLGKPVANLAEDEQGLVNRAGDQLALSGGNLVAAQIGRRLGLDDTSIEGTLDNASLVLGKYLSPRLYLSYGIGLAEAADFLKLRYQLSRRWSVQAESGIASSADLVFTIER